MCNIFQLLCLSMQCLNVFPFLFEIVHPSQQPSEFNTYYDIEAVYDCLKKDYAVRQEDLILYGQSVGSGPTLHLAARLQKARGVVLHSAILSGLRVLYPVKMTFWFDIFKVRFISLLQVISFMLLSIGISRLNFCLVLPFLHNYISNHDSASL